MPDNVAQWQIICGGCGEVMRFMGEWPIQSPREDKFSNMIQAYRWACKTCRIKSPNYDKGYCVTFGIDMDYFSEKAEYD